MLTRHHVLMSLVLVAVLLPYYTKADPSVKKVRIRFRQPVKVIHHYHTIRQYAKNFGYGQPIPPFYRSGASNKRSSGRRRRVKGGRRAYRRDRRYGLYNYANKYRNWAPKRRPYRPKYRARPPPRRRRPPHRYHKRGYSKRNPPVEEYPDRHEEEYAPPREVVYIDDYRPHNEEYSDQTDDYHPQYAVHEDGEYYESSPGYSYNDVGGSHYGSVYDEFQQNYEENSGYYPSAAQNYEDNSGYYPSAVPSGYDYEGAESVRRDTIQKAPSTYHAAPHPTQTTPTSQNHYTHPRPNLKPPKRNEYHQPHHDFSYRHEQPHSTSNTNTARIDISKIKLTNPEPQLPQLRFQEDHDIGYGEGLEDVNEGVYTRGL